MLKWIKILPFKKILWCGHTCRFDRANAYPYNLYCKSPNLGKTIFKKPFPLKKTLFQVSPDEGHRERYVCNIKQFAIIWW